MLGNLVVLQTFVQNEKLRTMNNLYIMNLAIADFLIGMAKGSNCNHPGLIMSRVWDPTNIKSATD